MAQEPEPLKTVPFDERFRDASWSWLQDPELRWIVDAGEQSWEEQLRWYQSLATRNDYLIWGVEYAGTPVAVFGFKNVTPEGTAEWFIFIGAHEFRRRGIGDWMVLDAEAKARERGLKEVWGWVRPENEPVIHLARRHGYELGPIESNGRRRVHKPLDSA